MFPGSRKLTSQFPENEISGDQKRERSEPSPLALSGAVGGAKPARWASKLHMSHVPNVVSEEGARTVQCVVSQIETPS